MIMSQTLSNEALDILVNRAGRSDEAYDLLISIIKGPLLSDIKLPTKLMFVTIDMVERKFGKPTKKEPKRHNN